MIRQKMEDSSANSGILSVLQKLGNGMLSCLSHLASNFWTD